MARKTNLSDKVNNCNFSLEKSFIDGRFKGDRLSLSFQRCIFGQNRTKIMTKYLYSRRNHFKNIVMKTLCELLWKNKLLLVFSDFPRHDGRFWVCQIFQFEITTQCIRKAIIAAISWPASLSTHLVILFYKSRPFFYFPCFWGFDY